MMPLSKPGYNVTETLLQQLPPTSLHLVAARRWRQVPREGSSWLLTREHQTQQLEKAFSSTHSESCQEILRISERLEGRGCEGVIEAFEGRVVGKFLQAPEARRVSSRCVGWHLPATSQPRHSVCSLTLISISMPLS